MHARSFGFFLAIAMLAAVPARADTTAAASTPASPAAVKASVSSPEQSRAGTSAVSPAPVTPKPDVAAARKSLPCSAALGDTAKLGMPLTRTARVLAGSGTLKIVAVGSSSTAGAGASSPTASYPSRLLVELRQRFPGHDIVMLNRGVNGEEAADMMDRFDTQVLNEKPDLILWQVGTNAVLRDHPLDVAERLIHEGVQRLKGSGADVVLIDPQFSPQVIAKPEAQPMVDLIATAAKRENVGLFRRYAVMRNWRETEGMAFDAFVSPDQLHMNDWSYACVAKVLGSSIADAAMIRTTAVARSSGPSDSTVRALDAWPAP
jgi:acyl-CoA thioesterase-1